MSYWKKIDDLVARVLDWVFADDKSRADVNEAYEDGRKSKVKKGRGRTKDSKKKKTKISQKSWPR